MDIKLRFVVHSKTLIYDDLIVTSLSVTQHVNKHDNKKSTSKNTHNEQKIAVYAPHHLNNKKIDSYAVSAYIYTLKRSPFYLQCSVRPLFHYVKARGTTDEYPVILIGLKFPKKQFLDYKWGTRITQMALERREVDHAMSWLSTLGGAFSALGEHFQHCAQMAGKISVHQFKLALRLGDPLLVARCKLYAALSMIQQGNLVLPKLMIRDIFEFAVKEKDTHLRRMCQGVWAKLSYCYKLSRQRKKQLRK